MKKAIILGLLACSTLLVGCSNSNKTSKTSKESEITKSSLVKTSEENSSPKSEATVDNSSVESTEGKQAEPQTVGDLDIDAIQKGDFSSLVGIWQNSKGDMFTINNDNTIVTTSDGQTGHPLKLTTGTASTGVPYLNVNSENGPGFALALFKIGFKNPAGDQSDTSRPRIVGTQNGINYPSEAYCYRK